MLKWFKKKNKILYMILFAALLVSVPSFDSYAMTQVGNTPIGQSNIFTRLDGNLEERNMYTLSDEKSLTLSSNNLETSNYYLVLFYNVQKSVNEYWQYTPISDKQLVFSTLNFKYGGQVYPLANNISSFVIQGQYSRFGSLEYNANVILSPHTPGDGYIYENSVQIEYIITGEVRTYKLESSEVAEAKHLVEIVNAVNSLAATNQNYGNIIMSELNKILSSNVRLEDTLSALYDLLEGVYTENDSDKVITDKFAQDSNLQSNQLNNLTEQSQVNKIDINSASSTVDSNIDFNAVGQSGIVLSAFTNHGKVLPMILTVLTVSLVAYVFFGKR